ncbi:MAG: hypothetical protein FWD67_07495, partial [Betaproteobacteria bacterium]|nr:hypothetical protein [Betaproteobacteria bacterium]
SLCSAEEMDKEPSPKTFIIDEFSDQYYGKLSIEDENENEIFTPGQITIHRKSDHKELINVKSDSLYYEKHDGKVKANIREIPYGEQGVIMYDDFNFDGIKDFAIMDGHESCYGGPSFSIYLGNKKGEFVYNEDFSRLAHDYCGMFNYDPTEKMIYVMTKSGCCWHQISHFALENNTPVEVFTKILRNKGSFEIADITRRVGNKTIDTTTRSLSEDVDRLLEFNLNNDKKVLVYTNSDKYLDYLLYDKKGNIEFSYDLDAEKDTEDKTKPFVLDINDKENTLSFQNENTTYEIYETKTTIGIRVTDGGKKYNLKGQPASKKGSLSKIYEDHLNKHEKGFQNLLLKNRMP